MSEQGIKRLEKVENDKKSVASKRIVLAIVQLNQYGRINAFITIALEVSSKIADPVEYVDSLIAVFDMAKDENECIGNIITHVTGG